MRNNVASFGELNHRLRFFVIANGTKVPYGVYKMVKIRKQ